MPADDYCYLTTTGRRTGRRHRIEIWYAAEENTLFLLAGAGRRSDWVQNLLADPDVSVEVDGVVRSATARIVELEQEATHARSLVFEKYQPRGHGDLSHWRDTALPVALDLSL
jgi:deazaflavin-dependent oxidoreductase (nitroreductase family)